MPLFSIGSLLTEKSPQNPCPPLCQVRFWRFLASTWTFGAIDWRKSKRNSKRRDLLWKVIFCPASTSGPVFMEAYGNKTRVAAKWPLLIWAASTSLLNNKSWFYNEGLYRYERACTLILNWLPKPNLASFRLSSLSPTTSANEMVAHCLKLTTPVHM